MFLLYGLTVFILFVQVLKGVKVLNLILKTL